MTSISDMTVKEAADKLARLSAVRRATPTMSKRAFDLPGSLSRFGSQVGQKFLDLPNWAKGSIVGAGGGALAGAGSSVLSRRKRVMPGVISGALAGGLGGAGVGMMYDHGRKAFVDSDPEVAKANALLNPPPPPKTGPSLGDRAARTAGNFLDAGDSMLEFANNYGSNVSGGLEAVEDFTKPYVDIAKNNIIGPTLDASRATGEAVGGFGSAMLTPTDYQTALGSAGVGIGGAYLADKWSPNLRKTMPYQKLINWNPVLTGHLTPFLNKTVGAFGRRINTSEMVAGLNQALYDSKYPKALKDEISKVLKTPGAAENIHRSWQSAPPNGSIAVGRVTVPTQTVDDILRSGSGDVRKGENRLFRRTPKIRPAVQPATNLRGLIGRYAKKGVRGGPLAALIMAIAPEAAGRATKYFYDRKAGP